MTDTDTPAPRRRRALIAATFGNAIEYFDFAVYGFVAVAIGRAFFPAADPAAQLLATFGVFGLTFFVRPLGAVVFGPIGDRVGRKRVLVIALLMMSVATAGIGLLPSYAAIGIAAPILLVVLRSVQALSAGGEFGGMAAFLLEYSAPGRRGLGASWGMFSSLLGFLLGLATVAVLTAALGTGTMTEWGWRIPFLLAAPLGLVGLYIRARLEDTPEFRRLQERGALTRAPLREALRYPRQLLTTTGIAALHACAFYVVVTYMYTYIGTTAGLGTPVALLATLLGGLFALIVTPLLGALSDRVGRRPILVAAASGFFVLSVPLFALVRSGPLGAVLGQIALSLLLGLLISTTLAAMTEHFPAHVRSTASSVAYMVAAAVFGGTAPFVGAFLVGVTGSTLAPAGYLMATAALCLLACRGLGTAVGSDDFPRTPTTAADVH